MIQTVLKKRRVEGIGGRVRVKGQLCLLIQMVAALRRIHGLGGTKKGTESDCFLSSNGVLLFEKGIYQLLSCLKLVALV